MAVPKIYLAGPEVFLPDAREVMAAKAALTRSAGLEPVMPGDNKLPPMATRRELGLAISAINEKLIRGADALIANLTPFRGIAADVGTVFELGFMCALARPVYGFTNTTRDHFTRVAEDFYNAPVLRPPEGPPRGSDGVMLEDFGMADNLMIDGGIEAHGGVIIRRDVDPAHRWTDLGAFEECVAVAAEQLLGGAP